MYYLRTRPAADPIKFTVDKSKLKSTNTKEIEQKNGVTNGTTNGEAKVANGNGVYTNGHANGTTNGNHTTEVPAEEGQNGDAKKDIDNTDLIEQLKLACSLKNKDACVMCSS